MSPRKVVLLSLLATLLLGGVAAADGSVGKVTYTYGAYEGERVEITSETTGNTLVNTDNNFYRRNYTYSSETITACRNWQPQSGSDSDGGGSQTTNTEVWFFEPFDDDPGQINEEIPLAFNDETWVCFNNARSDNSSSPNHDYNAVFEEDTPPGTPGESYTGLWGWENFRIEDHDDPDNDGISDSTRSGGDDCPNTYGSKDNGCPFGSKVDESYTSPGSYTYTVPQGVSGLQVKLYGAGGGDNQVASTLGGTGGYTEATINVDEGDTLNVYVGGKGEDQTDVHVGGANGGFNGGGNTICDTDDGTYGDITSAAGGGSSDIRLNGDTIDDRVVVAGGGGGAGNKNNNGGDGNPLEAEDGEVASSTYNGNIFTQGGGQKESTGYQFLFGRDSGSGGLCAGGGGGGYVGGEGGNYKDSNGDWVHEGRGGGGGGSAYINDTVVDNAQLVQGGGNDGDGAVVISQTFFLGTQPTDWEKDTSVNATASFPDNLIGSIDYVVADVYEGDTEILDNASFTNKTNGTWELDNVWTPDKSDQEYTLEVTSKESNGDTTTQSITQVIDPIDSDGDGVRDTEDECPNTAGELDNGCPDFDQDGIQDSEDECPETFGELPNGCPNTPPENLTIFAPDEVQKNEEFSASVSVDDPDDQTLSYSWNVGGSGDTITHSFSSTGTNKLKVTVDDGLDTTSESVDINVTDQTYPSGTTDLDINFTRIKPKNGENLTSTPVDYEFAVNGNNGTVELYRERNTNSELLKGYDHDKGNVTYTFTEYDTPIATQEYRVLYERDVDGKTVWSNATTFTLSDITDADGDGVRDNLDDCPNTAGVLDNGCPDDDGDGVQNSDDDCQTTYGLKNNGCPNSAPENLTIDYESSFLENETATFEASVNHADSGQSLSYDWGFTENGATVSQSFAPGNYSETLTVSDGINSTSKNFSFEVQVVEQDEPQADIETEITAIEPENDQTIPDNPVDFDFKVKGNNGTIFIQHKPVGTNDLKTLRKIEHDRGEENYLERVSGISAGNYSYSISFKREADNAAEFTEFREYEVLGKEDSDDDGVADVNDDCVDTFGLKDNGCPNSPPEIDTFDVPTEVNEGENFTVNMTGSDLDLEQTLNYSWSFGASGQDATACFDAVGYKKVKGTVTDGVEETTESQVVKVKSNNKSCEPISYENPYESDNIVPRSNITTQFDLQSPINGEKISPSLLSFDFEVTANIGELRIIRNGTTLATITQDRGTQNHSLATSDFQTATTYNWKVEYTRKADDNVETSSSESFYIEEPTNFESDEKCGNDIDDDGDGLIDEYCGETADNDSDDEEATKTNPYNFSDGVTEPTNATYSNIAEVVNGTIVYDWEVNGSSGSVSLNQEGEEIFSAQKTGTGVSSFHHEEDVPHTGFVYYNATYTTDGGQTDVTADHYVYVPPPPDKIWIDEVEDKVGANQSIQYNWTIGTDPGNVSFSVNGDEIFNESKDKYGNVSYSVTHQEDEYGQVSYTASIDLDDGGTKSDTQYYDVFLTQPELCGDGIDNDEDGDIDENCEDDTDSTPNTGGSSPDDETNESVDAEITFSPTNFSQQSGTTERRYVTIDNGYNRDVRIQMALSNSCNAFEFRGINEYTKKIEYNVGANTQPDIPIRVFMSPDETETVCQVDALSVEGDEDVEDFNLRVTSDAQAQTVQTVQRTLSPLTGFFFKGNKIALCTDENVTSQNCRNPSTLEVSPIAILGGMFLIGILASFLYNFYLEYYRGTPRREKKAKRS